ncbi:MAG: hypothetical protein PF549_03190 [Patescibacteria group bacterium]|jgi:hypothetical protein|nr:hypothetical protein [Patescibacteria group bacterium]
MCENSNEIVLTNLIDAIWDDDGEAIGLCLSSVSLNPEVKGYIIAKIQNLDKGVANEILKLLN